jgi:hypothetical protein
MDKLATIKFLFDYLNERNDWQYCSKYLVKEIYNGVLHSEYILYNITGEQVGCTEIIFDDVENILLYNINYFLRNILIADLINIEFTEINSQLEILICLKNIEIHIKTEL